VSLNSCYIYAVAVGLRHLPYADYPDLLVGADTSDDAAVYKINDKQAVVVTTDFFMPIGAWLG
jgi:selenophosphate synthase